MRGRGIGPRVAAAVTCTKHQRRASFEMEMNKQFKENRDFNKHISYVHIAFIKESETQNRTLGPTLSGGQAVAVAESGDK